MKLNVIVAADLDGAIGHSETNSIPWRLSADLRRFKQLTSGYPVIMGLNTFRSLPNGPLPNRLNIILTSRPHLIEDTSDALVTHSSLSDAITYCKKQLNVEHAFIIGGARIYADALENFEVDTIYKTLVYIKSGGDVKFPNVNFDKWDLSWMQPNTEKDIRYTFLRYDRM